MFKVGDKVRRTYGSSFGQSKGYEGVVDHISAGWLHFADGTRGLINRFELVQPVGPVVTETVTKTRIVPGVYDGVKVVEVDDDGFVSIEIVDGNDCPRWMDADQLDAAAAVLSALAKGLRDA